MNAALRGRPRGGLAQRQHGVEKLRATGLLAGALYVFIRTSPWRDGPLTLLGHALRLLRGLYRSATPTPRPA